MSDNNFIFTKSRGAIGSRVKHDYITFSGNNITKIKLREAGILYTVLLFLEAILLEAFGLRAEDYLGNEGSGSSSSSERIFPGIR